MENIIEERIAAGQCPGFCCEGFTMSVSMEDRQLMIDAQTAGLDHWIDSKGHRHNGWYVDDYVSPQFIQDMLILTGEEWGGSPLHSCKHFDKEKRLCTIYDRRPGLCRIFPFAGHPCDFAHKGCTFQNKEEVRPMITDFEI